MVQRKNRTTNAIRGLNETDLIVGAVGIAAGIAAFFTGGTSIAAYAAFVADVAGVMGSAGGIASGSLQVQQGKTSGNKKESREGWESIGFGIGGLAAMGMGAYSSTKYFSENPWLRSAIRGASASLDVGMMATGTALTIKSDVTGNGGIGLKVSNWQGDLALAESVLGIGMFGVQSYNAYNEYSIQLKATTTEITSPFIGVKSDEEILDTANARATPSKTKLAKHGIPEMNDDIIPNARNQDNQEIRNNFIQSAKNARAENNNFDANQLEITGYTILDKEECPRVVIRVLYKGKEYYFYRSSGGAGKKYVGDGYYVTGGVDMTQRMLKISDTLTKEEVIKKFPSQGRSKYYKNKYSENSEMLENYFNSQGAKEEDLYISRQGDIRLFQHIAKYLNDRFM